MHRLVTCQIGNLWKDGCPFISTCVSSVHLFLQVWRFFSIFGSSKSKQLKRVWCFG
jgi:hypothetical protein